MNKIGIIGLGLIGGSIAKALKHKQKSTFIVATDTHIPSLQQAMAEKIIDGYTTTIDETFSRCDFIFLCTPVEKIMEIFPTLLPLLSSDCIVTDVGSTKQSIVKFMNQHEQEICFIGGHPMTGSEKTGYGASTFYLFENAYYILTPTSKTPADKLQELTDLIASLGAFPITMDPLHHDFVTASISHVPHVIAAALVNLIKDLDSSQGHMKQLAAGGFKDITRIASSSPDMWAQICSTNQGEILKVLQKMQERLSAFEHSLINHQYEDIWRFFDDAKEYRNEFSNRSPGPLIKAYEVVVDMVDEPGGIAEVATMLSQHGINIKNIGIVSNREYENGVLQILFETKEEQKQSIVLLEEIGYRVYKK
ncbi:MAG: prephenate dehydrogenase [Epulopiscium sp.]|nr:prephenate dehydrogenase [Candidatus Epulonipiscium sp.]